MTKTTRCTEINQMIRATLAVTLISLSVTGNAQEKKFSEEYQNRIKSTSNISARNDAPFGENLDLYTGTVTFSQQDITLEGKGPPIRIVRISNDSDDSTINPQQFSGFGDWMLEVPMIQTLAPGTLKYGATTGEWKVMGPSSWTADRCTYFGEMWTPPDGYYGGTSLTAPTYSWWSGYTLYIPGEGPQPILSRLSAAPVPSIGNYPGITTRHYQVGCQSGLGTSNGLPGEGFIVLSPDGTKYFMTHLSFATYSTYREADPTDPTIIARVGRVIARMKATRVEDRFGNYITYTYTGDKLTAISASDGRSVAIQWRSDAPLIQSITANGRSWNYIYSSPGATGGFLSQVTLPDGSSWNFSGVMPSSRSRPVAISGCMPGPLSPSLSSESGITSSYTIKNPSGASGVFRFSGRLRAQSHMGTLCIADPWSGLNGESANPYYYVNALVQREISGPGIAPATWSYVYEPPYPSALRNCPGTTCQSTSYTDVYHPDGLRTRHVHSTRYGPIQGKHLRSEYYNTTSSLIRREDSYYNYAESDLPYPSTFGNSLYQADPAYGSENLVLVRKSVITQSGVIFSKEVPSGCAGGLNGYCFDGYGRPTKIIRSSSP